MSATIEGMDALLAALDAQLARLDQNVDAMIERAGNTAQATAKDHARVDTGTMRDGTIHTHTHLESDVSNAVPHAVFNEFGTYKMSPAPFMLPGYIAGKQQALSEAKDVL